MEIRRTLVTLSATALLSSACSALAADEHGHDHDAPAATSGPSLPRFAAVSEAFELVGVLKGTQLVVYLDRFADNAPVEGAAVELELGGVKVALKEHEPGEFEGELSQAPEPGLIAVTATVVAGKETDILAGELDLHEELHAAEEHLGSWQAYALPTVGGLALLAVVAWGARRLSGARRTRAGAAA